MNFRLLSKVLGLLLILLSGTMLLCLAYAWWIHERHPGLDAMEAFAISVGGTLLGGCLLLVLGRGGGREVFRKEAIAIVGLGWIVCGVFGALPYWLCAPQLGATDGLFESISGFTTTGATVIGDLDPYPRSVLLWRALTQWLGGLGILVLFVALLSYLGVGSKALFHHESTAKSGEGLQARIRDVAVRLWQIYLVLSAVCFVGLKLLGMDFYDALTHTLTAVSTGGFSPRDESVSAYGSFWIELWLMLFMILGAISFMLYAWLLQGRWERWRKEEETKLFFRIIVVAALIIAADLVMVGQYESVWIALRTSMFQVTSILTTTGYMTDDYDLWPPFSRVVLLLLMFVGGCAGSTSGGIKVGRWLLFFKVLRRELIAVYRPNQILSLHLNGNLVDDALKLQAVFFIALAGVSVAIGTALVSMLDPAFDVMSCLSAVITCLFNIGPGMGLVGPTDNFAGLSVGAKFVLSLLMVIGRLEFFAILVLFTPSLWRRY